MNNNQEIKIKMLETGDVGYFRQLNEMFADVFEDRETYLENQPSEAYLESLLKKDHILVCVALHESRVIAGLVAYVLEKFEQERSEIYIYDLGVDAGYRRQKIATRLIESLKAKAESHGAWVIYVQADAGDLPAMKLYQSLGVQEEVLHYDIRVNRD